MSDFEEYVAGRGPALVAFALLVTGREDEAHRLAQNALGRALARWESVVHDEDPDAHLRRDVVTAAARGRWRPAARAGRGTPGAGARGDAGGEDAEEQALWRRWARLPVLTRAALTLRYVEERSWPEVSWTTGLSEAGARRRVDRGLSALAPAGPVPDQEVAGERLRDLLRRRTAVVETIPVELSSRAARVSRLRRDRQLRGGAAALLVAAVGVPLAVSLWPGVPGLGDLDPSPDDGTTLETVLPEGFRTEAWRGVEVGVPEEWGYGALGSWCEGGGLPTPRVERPGPFDDTRCDPLLAPGVQFRLEGDPAPDVPEGLVVEERLLDGDVVLVATPDADLTAQVLATARLVERADSHGCAVQRAIPRAGKNFAPVEASSTALSVCRYQVGISGPNLMQSERLSVIDSLDAREAVEAAPTVVAPQGCLDGPGEEAIALTTAEGDLAWIHLGRCQGLDDDGTHLLTEDVLFWALSPGWAGPRADLPLPPNPRGVPAG